MTDDEHLQKLNITAQDIERITDDAYQQVLTNLDTGMAPRDAISSVMSQWNDEFLVVFGSALSERLVLSIGTTELKSYQVGGIRLSTLLYRNARQVEAVVSGIVGQHLQGWHSARELALLIYEGYGFKADEPLKVRARLPKYLRAAFGDDQAFNDLWRHRFTGRALRALAEDVGVGPELARLYARIKAGQLKTQYLKAAYLQALDALQNGVGKTKLNKLLKVAFYERNRYFANRIAQTELHKAHSLSRSQELMEQDYVGWVQIVLSKTHPRTDICDMHAKIDQYGMGAGVYPKPKAPMPPFHPHCRCLIRPRIDIDPDEKYRMIKGAERELLRSMPIHEARMIAGSKKKLQAVFDGGNLETILNANKDPLYHLKRVEDI